MFPFESMGVVFLRVSGAITFEYWLKWVKWIDFSNQKLTRNYSSNASNSVLSSQSIIFLLFIPPRAHQANINRLNLLIIFRMLPISICYDLSPEAFILLFRTFFFFFFSFPFVGKRAGETSILAGGTSTFNSFSKHAPDPLEGSGAYFSCSL